MKEGGYNTRQKSFKTCVFPLPQCWFGYYSRLSAPKYAWLKHWGRRGAHLSENKGVKSECRLFGENSRETVSVSTICDEYRYIVSKLHELKPNRYLGRQRRRQRG